MNLSLICLGDNFFSFILIPNAANPLSLTIISAMPIYSNTPIISVKIHHVPISLLIASHPLRIL